MALAMSALLIHDEQVPEEARRAVKAAYEAPPEQRTELLVSAARVLHRTTDLPCDDVREIFDLATDDDGCASDAAE
jgi:uncharacterized protein (UPF0147 family)